MKSKTKKKILKIVLVAAGALLILGTLAFIYFHSLYSLMNTDPVREDIIPESTPLSVKREATPSPRPTPDPNNPLNSQDIYSVLLMGTDDRDNALNSRTDTMMLVTINQDTQEIILTSFLRDTYVWIPDWGYQRLNVANEVGGPEKVKDTLRDAYGAEADNYAYVNFYSFIDVVDALGGIDLELTDDEVYFINVWINDEDLIVGYDKREPLEKREDHQYHLNGSQTLAYCRTRDLGSDLVRTGQQRRVITEIFSKMKNAPLGDLLDVMTSVLPQITTDLPMLSCVSLLHTLADIGDYNIVQLQIPADGTFEFSSIEGMSVLTVDFDANRQIFYNTIHGIHEEEQE